MLLEKVGGGDADGVLFVMHNDRYLVSPDGEFQEFYTQLASVQECVERITTTIEKYEAEQESK